MISFAVHVFVSDDDHENYDRMIKDDKFHFVYQDDYGWYFESDPVRYNEPTSYYGSVYSRISRIDLLGRSCDTESMKRYLYDKDSLQAYLQKQITDCLQTPKEASDEK